MILEKGAFRECLNRKWSKGINRFSTLKSDLVRKVKNAKMVNIDEIIFYFKSQYLAHDEGQRTFIQPILREENMLPFEAITGYLKTFSKSIKEDENMRKYVFKFCRSVSRG